MVQERGSEKHEKALKILSKFNGFGRSKTFQNVVRVIKNQSFRFCEKVSKMTAKWVSNIIKNLEN